MRCEWIKDDGEQCKANARDGEKYCSIHLKMAEERGLEADQSLPELQEDLDGVDEINIPEEEESGEEAQESDDAMAKAPAVINKTMPRRIRYTGKGSYSIPSCGITFYRPGQVEEVPYETWVRLHENGDAKDVFEEV